MLKVCIQVAAGSCDVNIYNEKTLDFRRTARISRPYPYPYGFILETTAADGDNLDCYLITRERLEPGAIVDCEPLGLLEQHEDGEIDHKILAAMPGQDVVLTPALLQELQDFIYAVFAEFPQMRVRVGPLLPREAALQHIQACRSAARMPENRILFFWKDDEDTRNMFSLFLQEHGYRLETVRSWDACVEICTRKPPLLLILDRSMNQPEDGLLLVRALRSQPQIPYFPVILGEADFATREKEQGYREAFEAGANACFGRVFDIANVWEQIKRLVDHPEATNLADR